MARMGSSMEAHLWTGWLPDSLRPVSVPPRHSPAQASPTALPIEKVEHDKESATSSEERPRRPLYQPQGLPVTGRVWEFSQDPKGCREVQHALDSAQNEEDRIAIAMELKGHVGEALRCPHANHVLQKCIISMRPQVSQFIVEELLASGIALQAARHKYGCRIVQRILEHCPPWQVKGLSEVLLGELGPVARHPYGNYVAQHMLLHGTSQHRLMLCEALSRDIRGMGADPYGCAVVSAALAHGPHEGQVLLARTLLKEPALLVFMACSRHGHVAAKMTLQVLTNEELQLARKVLSAEAKVIAASRYGRMVAACIPPPEAEEEEEGETARAGGA